MDAKNKKKIITTEMKRIRKNIKMEQEDTKSETTPSEQGWSNTTTTPPDIWNLQEQTLVEGAHVEAAGDEGIYLTVGSRYPYAVRLQAVSFKKLFDHFT